MADWIAGSPDRLTGPRVPEPSRYVLAACEDEGAIRAEADVLDLVTVLRRLAEWEEFADLFRKVRIAFRVLRKRGTFAPAKRSRDSSARTSIGLRL